MRRAMLEVKLLNGGSSRSAGIAQPIPCDSAGVPEAGEHGGEMRLNCTSSPQTRPFRVALSNTHANPSTSR